MGDRKCKQERFRVTLQTVPEWRPGAISRKMYICSPSDISFNTPFAIVALACAGTGNGLASPLLGPPTIKPLPHRLCPQCHLGDDTPSPTAYCGRDNRKERFPQLKTRFSKKTKPVVCLWQEENILPHCRSPLRSSGQVLFHQAENPNAV